MTKDQIISAIAEQEQRKKKANERIAELSTALGEINSGFKVGDRIKWAVKTWKTEGERRGEVISVKGRGSNRYELRVRLLKKDGTLGRQAQVVTDWEKPEKLEPEQ